MKSIVEGSAVLALGIGSWLSPSLPAQEGLPLCGPNNVQALNEDGSISATDNVTGEECFVAAETTTITTVTAIESGKSPSAEAEVETGQGITFEEGLALGTIGLMGLAGTGLLLALGNGKRVRRRDGSQ